MSDPRPKVPIPRLNNDRKRNDKSRVQRACNQCRKRKVKCTGEQPACRYCVNERVRCYYEPARKDRLKDCVDQNNLLIAFLKDQSARVDDGEKQRIHELLDSLDDSGSVADSSVTGPTVGKRSRANSTSDEESRGGSRAQGGEADVSGSVGSNNDLDLLDEDLLRSDESRATGFLGRNSEVQWLRSLKTHMEADETPGQPSGQVYGPPGHSRQAADRRADAVHTRQGLSKPGSIRHVSDSNFYLDFEDVDLQLDVDPWTLPPLEMSEKLFACYMETVHSSFPILPPGFEEDFRNLTDAAKQRGDFRLSKYWQAGKRQAQLNLVFAIGSKFSHVIQADWQGDERDHMVYVKRAIKLLELDKVAVLLSAPELPLIQATGLLSLYYLAIGHISRAWIIIGISLRFALAVGLHLRNEDPTAEAKEKESRVRVWWGLHAVESLLCSIIGRPCVISDEQCTVPLPQVLPEEQSGDNIPPHLRDLTSGGSQSPKFSRTSLSGKLSRHNSDEVARRSFLGARITIGLIMQKSLSKLYSPRTATASWEDVQKDIASLTAQLDEWVVAAVPDWELGVDDQSQDPSVRRERLLLAFWYHSTKLVISRPCLCRLEGRIKRQSELSAGFNQSTAKACVESAKAITRLLPDEPDRTFFGELTPWWCIVHNIMQALAVFLLELSFERAPVSGGAETIADHIRKLVRWLRFMSVTNAVAQRAYGVAIDIIRTGAPKIQVDISDILADEQYTKQNCREAFPFNNFAEASNFNFPLPTGMPGEQLPVHGFTELPMDPFSMLETDLQMPSTLGNPFFSSFDQANPLNDLWPNTDPTILDDPWSAYPTAPTGDGTWWPDPNFVNAGS